MAFADTGTEESVWEIPAAGIDITLPDSWKESDFYKIYQTMEFEPEMIVTTAVMYDVPEDEVMAKEEELGDIGRVYGTGRAGNGGYHTAGKEVRRSTAADLADPASRQKSNCK